MLRTGFAEIEITPEKFGHLGRIIAVPTQATGVVWPLFARAVILENNGLRLAVISVDMNFIFTQNIREIREHIAPAAGLHPDHIMIACTHTHNSFNTSPWQEEDEADYRDLDIFKDQLYRLVTAAAERLCPCRVKAGSAIAKGLTENRRPLYRAADGRLHVGTHGPENVDNYAGREGPTDDEVKVLYFENEAGRCIGGLVNVAAHPTTMFSQPVYSSSYIGPMVEALKKKYGGVFGFLYGLSGNLCVKNKESSQKANTEKVGRKLAKAASSAITSAVPLAADDLAISHEILAIPLRRVTPAQILAAKKYQHMDPAKVDQKELCQALFGHDFIFYKPSVRDVEVFVREIIGTWEYLRRLGQRYPAGDIEVQVVRLGDAAIVSFGCELFCEVKHALQSISPFPHTFFASLTNGGNGYVPTRDAFSHGGYETCTGIASQFVEGTCDLLLQSALRQLRAIGTYTQLG